MSLARAFTKRVKRSDHPTAHLDDIRGHISSPVALISTTNMLSYNAPDISDITKQKPALHPDPSSPASSAPSTPRRASLDDDSDVSTPFTDTTDATSIGSSPATEQSPCDFSTPSSSAFPDKLAVPELEQAPIVPQRALSHSKREHERLARKRSLQFSRPTTPQSPGDSPVADTAIKRSRTSAASSSSSHGSMVVSPFSRELEQLSEVAEEFGAAARDAAIEEDLAIMRSRGLCKFAADDYILEIEPLWQIILDEVRPLDVGEAWI